MTDHRTRDPRELGLIVETRDPGGNLLYRAGIEWTLHPTHAQRWRSEDEALAAASVVGGTVRSLLETGDVESLAATPVPFDDDDLDSTF